MPVRDTVRIEELLNAHTFEYATPAAGGAGLFARSPLADARRVADLFAALRAAAVAGEEDGPAVAEVAALEALGAP